MASDIKLFNQDCLAAMKEMPDKAFDLAIVDPPYGIFSAGKGSTMGWLKQADGGTWGSKYKGQAKKWDIAPTKLYFDELKRVSKNQIIWGANYFGYSFQNFVIWRKLTISEGFSMSMAEIASVSCEGNGKVYEYQPQDQLRFHPTQKPVSLYKWLIKLYAKDGDKILDTHLGSGSIAIACYDMGCDLVGYEIDADYYNAAVKRLETHKKQLTLF